MKIKLETIGLQDLKIRHQQESQPRIGYLAAVAASLAAILFVSISLMPNANDGVAIPVALKSESGAFPIDYSPEYAVESLSSLRATLDPFQLTSMTSEWSAINPIRSLSACFDWLHRSLRQKAAEREEASGFGDLHRFRQELLYADSTLLACRV